MQDKVRNDTVSYKVKRHYLLQDIFSKKTLSVLTVSVETLLVVRHFLFLSKKTLSVVRYFQLSDILHDETLSVTDLPISVSWVMEFLIYRYKNLA